MTLAQKSSGRIFFILACARSGSTSLARILDEATNGRCAVEPAPNLNWEVREMMEGRLADPAATVKAVIAPRVEEALGQWQIYGEKNLTYGPFIPELFRQFDCRFVFLIRDVGNVVRSMMDWHNRMFGSIYRECGDPGELAPRAMFAAGQLPVHLDTSDYSRPRPRPGSLYFDRWDKMSREEMCAYYWSESYRIYLDQLEVIPDDRKIMLNYTSPAADDILRVADFLGLEGLDLPLIRNRLDLRINSLRDRISEAPRYPEWDQWPSDLQDRIRGIAEETSRRLPFAPLCLNSAVASR